jgi:hypothetical protein
MIIDHIGAVTHNNYLRILGRLALPLFLRLLIEGNEKSKDSKKYLGRLALFALISQIPYRLVFPEYLNIFFTLAISLQCLRINKTQYWIGAAITAQIIKTDYGSYGILLTWFLNELRKAEIKEIAWIKILSLNLIYAINYNYLLQIFSILGIIIKGTKKEEKRKISKWAYYWIYPIHLLIIWKIFADNHF